MVKRNNSLRSRVAIIGAGMIDFGELFSQGLEDMIEAAYLNALASVDKGLDPNEIEAAWLGTVYPAMGNTGLVLAHATGLFDIPVSRVENACATGSDAFRNASMAVAAGIYDVALVVGAEKMRDGPGGLIARSALKKL